MIPKTYTLYHIVFKGRLRMEDVEGVDRRVEPRFCQDIHSSDSHF